MLHRLAGRSALRLRADLLQQAYGTFLSILNELLAGRRIISVDLENLQKLNKYKELSVTAIGPLLFEHFEYLAPRPETGYSQLYLKGRNLALELIYKMPAIGLTDEEAATDMGLPVAQIREAKPYYQINRELVEQESLQEKERLDTAGVLLEPGNLPG